MDLNNSLPVILVSAPDRPTAEAFISELIDNEVKVEDGQASNEGRVWRIVNKYYRVDVEVRARGDGDPPESPELRVEGHVAYFIPQEVSGERAAERSAGGAGAGVRVAAVRAASVPDALGAWARRARYEPVALLAAAERGPFGGAGGVARVRAALHAHPWPGLRRLDRRTSPPSPLTPLRCCDSDEESSSGGEGDEADEGEEAAAVERAEQFARALGALGDAGTLAHAAASDAERLAHAEHLVAAFCRALGHDLDAC